MVETIWTKLPAPHAVIETSLRNSSQERNFLLQRPGGETGSFGSIAGAETALTREFGRHVFEIARPNGPHTSPDPAPVCPANSAAQHSPRQDFMKFSTRSPTEQTSPLCVGKFLSFPPFFDHGRLATESVLHSRPQANGARRYENNRTKSNHRIDHRRINGDRRRKL